MKTAIEIVKGYLIPKLEKVSNFNIETSSEDFWESFVDSLLIFETNGKPIYKLITSCNLSNEVKEKLISKTPIIYSKLIKELAEEYVKGNTSKAIGILLNSKGTSFKGEVEFFYILKKASEIAERKRIKEELPLFFERLKNQISNSDQ
ncbi:hypothetical protein ACRASX_08835 [Flavobacterium sp. TMP13]|uniref:hypothetical protein n=1 Tax=Flavobacterium sp. TMP13 TaxID=3425950 RepID=UPI003D774F33